jgi:hypothetical protein
VKRPRLDERFLIPEDELLTNQLTFVLRPKAS